MRYVLMYTRKDLGFTAWLVMKHVTLHLSAMSLIMTHLCA